MAARGSSVVTAGGVVVEYLISRSFVLTPPPSKTDLESWIGASKIPVTSVIPGGGAVSTFDVNSREATFVIDLKTMTNVKKDAGDKTGLGTTGAQRMIDAILVLLK